VFGGTIEIPKILFW